MSLSAILNLETGKVDMGVNLIDEEGAGGNSPIVVGTVTNTSTSFPTTRGDGSALVLGDRVNPLPSSTFPFTVAGVTFESARSYATYGGSGLWLPSANPFQKTDEVPVTNKAQESVTGNANTQKEINIENKAKFAEKVDKSTATISVEHAYIHKADGTDGLMEINSNANTAGAIVRRDSDKQINVPLQPTGNDDATSKWYADTELAKKVDKTATANQVYVTDNAGAQTTKGYDTASTADTMVMRIGGGRAKVGTPIEAGDAANKDYVDEQTLLVDDATLGKGADKKAFLKDSGVSTAKLADGAVTNAKVADNTLTKSKTSSEFWQGNSFAGNTTAVNLDVSTKILVPTPASDMEAATKKYADEKIDDSLTSGLNKTWSIDKIIEEIRIAGATFRGAFANKAALDAYTGPKEKNDRAIVTADETKYNATTLYSYDGSAWVFEYVVSTKPLELDGTTIDYDPNGKVSLKDEAVGLNKFAKHTSDVKKVYQILADGTTGLERLTNYTEVSTFDGLAGDVYTLYYLNAPCVVGTKSYGVGCYAWNSANGFRLVANVGDGAASPIFLGYVVSGGTFPIARPDASPLVIGDYVRPDINSVFPFTIGTVTFNNVKDEAMFVSTGNWLLNISSIQKTNETPVNNKNNESINGSNSLAVYQADINAENAVAINAKLTQYQTMPAASANYLGKVVQYLGATTTNYTHGFLYECKENAGAYSWDAVPLQASVDISIRENSKAYSAGARVLYPNKAGYVLVCKISGTTSPTLPAFPASVQSGVTVISDGTIDWYVYDISDSLVQLTTFPIVHNDSPLSFQYVGTEAGYEQFALYKKSETAPYFGLSANYSGYVVSLPELGDRVDVYVDSGCTVLKPDLYLECDGADSYSFFDNDLITSESASVNGTPAYVKIEKPTLTQSEIDVGADTTGKYISAQLLHSNLPLVGMRKNSTAYSFGARAYFANQPGYLIVCSGAGTSGTYEPTFPDPIQSGVTTFEDGTVEWTVYDMADIKFVPQLSIFPTYSATSPESFQYIGTETGKEKFALYKKVAGNYTVTSASYGTLYATNLPVGSSSTTLYDDAACTLPNLDYELVLVGVRYCVRDIASSNTVLADVTGGPGYQKIEFGGSVTTDGVTLENDATVGLKVKAGSETDGVALSNLKYSTALSGVNTIRFPSIAINGHWSESNYIVDTTPIHNYQIPPGIASKFNQMIASGDYRVFTDVKFRAAESPDGTSNTFLVKVYRYPAGSSSSFSMEAYSLVSGLTYTGRIDSTWTSFSGWTALATTANVYTKTESDTAFLKKTGGTMTGILRVLTGAASIQAPDDSNYITIGGGSSFSTGGWIQFVGKDFATDSLKGTFIITANKGNGNQTQMFGYPDGTLTWGGKNISTNNVYYGTTAPANMQPGDLLVNADPVATGASYTKSQADNKFVAKGTTTPTLTPRSGWTLWGGATSIGGNKYYVNITIKNDTGSAQGSSDLVAADISGNPVDCCLSTACFESINAGFNAPGCVVQTQTIKFRALANSIPAGAYVIISGVMDWTA